MSIDVYDAVDLTLLTAAYWLLDRLVRADGFVQLTRRLPGLPNAADQVLWSLVFLATTPRQKRPRKEPNQFS